MHGDIIETNILRDRNNKLWFIDFSVSNYMHRIIDLAVIICDLCLDIDNIETSIRRANIFLKEYEKVYILSDYEKNSLKTFLKCHQAITILQTTKEKELYNNLSEENMKFLDKATKGLDLLMKFDLIN